MQTRIAKPDGVSWAYFRYRQIISCLKGVDKLKAFKKCGRTPKPRRVRNVCPQMIKYYINRFTRCQKYYSSTARWQRVKYENCRKTEPKKYA